MNISDNDQAHEICEQIYEQYRGTPHINQLDMMKIAFRAGRVRSQSEFYAKGYAAGSEHTATTLGEILESGVLRGSKDCGDTADATRYYESVPDGAPMVARGSP